MGDETRRYHIASVLRNIETFWISLSYDYEAIDDSMMIRVNWYLATILHDFPTVMQSTTVVVINRIISELFYQRIIISIDYERDDELDTARWQRIVYRQVFSSRSFVSYIIFSMTRSNVLVTKMHATKRSDWTSSFCYDGDVTGAAINRIIDLRYESEYFIYMFHV